MAELTAQTDSHLGIGMRKKTERTKGRGGWGKTEFGQNVAICLEEEAIFVKSYKCPYRVKFDVDLEVQHILSADYRPSCSSLVAIQPFACEKKRFS